MSDTRKKFTATVTITLRLHGEATDQYGAFEELQKDVALRLMHGYKSRAMRHDRDALRREFGGARAIYQFDTDKKTRFTARLYGAAKQSQTRRCRQCGCTDSLACEGGCWWTKRYKDNTGLCSTCAGKETKK